MNLLTVSPGQIDGDGTFSASPEQSEHIACILHANAGDRIRTGVLGGKIGFAELIEPSKRKAKLRILTLEKDPPAKKKLQFVIALPRPQSFKKCLHFIASAGIPCASFIQTERVEKSYWNSAAMRPEAVERELIEGLEQGVDTILPEIRFFRSFREWKQCSGTESFPGRKLIAHPVGALPCPAASAEPVLAAIGPEGGFIPSEVETFRELGFECVSLGGYILRVEFALSYMTGRLTPL